MLTFATWHRRGGAILREASKQAIPKHPTLATDDFASWEALSLRWTLTLRRRSGERVQYGTSSGLEGTGGSFYILQPSKMATLSDFQLQIEDAKPFVRHGLCVSYWSFWGLLPVGMGKWSRFCSIRSTWCERRAIVSSWWPKGVVIHWSRAPARRMQVPELWPTRWEGLNRAKQ